ncbi:MAG: transcriptional regulator [Methylococcales bacterium]|nr:transcriptional regulator [Methylococcales bacterium]
MRLAINLLNEAPSSFIEHVLSAVKRCHCCVIELRCVSFGEATGCQLWVEGNWNHIAKLETLLATLQSQTRMRMNLVRQENEVPRPPSGLPYLLETLSSGEQDVIHEVVGFLLERKVWVEDVQASRYVATYNQAPVFATRFVIIIPPEYSLLSLREEFLEFSDQLNIDAILEPIKR